MTKSAIINYIYQQSSTNVFKSDGEVFGIWMSVTNTGDENIDVDRKIYDNDTSGLVCDYGKVTDLIPGNSRSSRYDTITMPDHDWNLIGKIYIDSSSVVEHSLTRTLYLKDYYVKTTGNDSLSGNSWTNAWKTINKAATTVIDGITVHIGFGTYDAEPAANKIAPQNVGTSGIYYLPETATTGGGTGTVSVEQNA